MQGQRDQWETAEVLVREALSLLEETDDLDARAHALLSLARVLSETGKTRDAAAAAEEAVRLCDEKGNVVMGRDAARLLDELGS